MSSTNRGGKRNESDFYVTPPWVVDRLIEAVPLAGGRWLECCAGDGEIIRTVNKHRDDIAWSACELRPEMAPQLAPHVVDDLVLGDYLACDLEQHFHGKRFEVILTNPPFSIAWQVIQKSMTLANLTVMLLRLNFWGSAARHAFMREYPPDCYILPDRPVFSLNKYGKPGTDSIEYMWAVWNSYEQYKAFPKKFGNIRVLEQTPSSVRKAWNERLRALAAANTNAEQILPI